MALHRLLLFAVFLSYSAIQSPVPGVNEPHYFSKAKHYWNPAWCRGDIFLESANPHAFYYQTVGLLTRFVSLEATAWIARVVAFWLLAVGWERLMRHVLASRWAALWTACVYLLIVTLTTLSGEWIVGGVESKVFAYAFVFQTLAFVCERRWNRAAIAAGLAIGFHPVVGIWCLICGGAVLALPAFWHREHPGCPEQAECWRRFLLPGALLVFCSLPGLIPSLQMLGSAPAELSVQANYLQVYYRLQHHLDPMSFARTGVAAYAMFGMFCVVGTRWLPPDGNRQFLFRFVVAAALVAAVGFLLGFRTVPPEQMPLFEFRMSLLRFYFFRVADAMLPIAVAVVFVGLVEGRVGSGEWRVASGDAGDSSSLKSHASRLPFPAVRLAAFGGVFALALAIPLPDRNPSRMPAAQRGAWIDACRWIDANTPADGLFFTPRQDWAFKWYAQRAQYVSYKDLPQDAAASVEWNRRLLYLSRWSDDNHDGGYSRAAIAELHQATGITHIIERGDVRFDAPVIFENDFYRVYRVEAP